MISSALLLVSLVTLALGKPATPNLVPHETLKAPPGGFSRVGPADPNQTLKLRLALVQGNVTELERKLYDVSTPSSPNYGKYLSMAEANELVAPAQESVDAVDAWLKENGITTETISPSGDWRSFELSVSKANELFDADFSVFKHDGTGAETVRTLSYSIPAELEGHLDLVHPTVTFPNPMGQRPVFQVRGTSGGQNASNQAIPSACLNETTPACLQALYNIPTEPASHPESNGLAITGFNQDCANEADLEAFLKTYRPDMPSNTTFSLQTIDGGSNSQDPSKASHNVNMDTQYTVGVATGVPVTFISEGTAILVDFDLDVAHFLLSQNNPPNVVMTSYYRIEEAMSSQLAQNICNTFAQLGVRGVSVLFASGFYGVEGSPDYDTCTAFIPTFPSGCPFLTSVGSTQGIPEIGANFSGGGFSNIFSTPQYQATAVYRYLSSLGSTYQGQFNPSGRAFPDVSIQGVNYEILVDGESSTGMGSTAAFASIVSLLNDRLIAAGRTPLGFLNPFLYSVGADVLNDITAGSNPGCGTSGFPAKKGWDPVTGLGTPNFQRLAGALGL